MQEGSYSIPQEARFKEFPRDCPLEATKLRESLLKESDLLRKHQLVRLFCRMNQRFV